MNLASSRLAVGRDGHDVRSTNRALLSLFDRIQSSGRKQRALQASAKPFSDHQGVAAFDSGGSKLDQRKEHVPLRS